MLRKWDFFPCRGLHSATAKFLPHFINAFMKKMMFLLIFGEKKYKSLLVLTQQKFRAFGTAESHCLKKVSAIVTPKFSLLIKK